MFEIMRPLQSTPQKGLFERIALFVIDATVKPTPTPPESPTSTSTPVRVPIIVYHIVRPSYPTDSADVRKLAVTPEIFDAQLAYLQDAGYHVVNFTDLENYFASSAPLPAKPIILSFDDGWSDQYEYALPILEKYHDTATFFIFTNAIGHHGFFTADEIHALVAAGMSLGDHSRSHPYLTKITDPAKLWDEIDGSKVILESEFGVPVTVFAYPFGQYSTDTIATLQKAGFIMARSDYWSGPTQYSDHLYQLSAINVPTTLEKFKRYFP